MNRAFQSRFTYLLKNINGLSNVQTLPGASHPSELVTVGILPTDQSISNIPKTEIQRNLVKYFNLQYKETEMVSMNIDIDNTQENRIILSVEYRTKTSFVHLKDVPFEVSRLISSYVPYNKIHVKFAITFPKEYPFCPPKWTLEEDLSNISDISNLIVSTKQYYQELVDTHNNQYKRSPDLDIDGSEPYPFTKTSPHEKSIHTESYYWSPAHYIEKDLLNFILRINHFEYILQSPDLVVENYQERKLSTKIMKTEKKYLPWKFVLQ
jgi:hypothetical protein